jgi:hypothetical protein
MQAMYSGPNRATWAYKMQGGRPDRAARHQGHGQALSFTFYRSWEFVCSFRSKKWNKMKGILSK